MEALGKINKREIFYIDYDLIVAWDTYLPKKNWLLFAIADKDNLNVFTEINRKAIERNVCYVCSTGIQAELYHDVFDEDLIIREVESLYLPDLPIITTWHNKLEEALFFALFSAVTQNEEIQTIVCLNILGNNKTSLLLDCIKKIGASDDGISFNPHSSF